MIKTESKLTNEEKLLLDRMLTGIDIVFRPGPNQAEYFSPTSGFVDCTVPFLGLLKKNLVVISKKDTRSGWSWYMAKDYQRQ